VDVISRYGSGSLILSYLIVEGLMGGGCVTLLPDTCACFVEHIRGVVGA
jgi:hypothetical protein